MKRDIRINYGALDDLTKDLINYYKAIKEIKRIMKSNQKIFSAQKGTGFSEIQLHNSTLTKKIEGKRIEIEQVHYITRDYSTDMSKYISPKSRNSDVRVSRNSIWLNMKQIDRNISKLNNLTKGLGSDPASNRSSISSLPGKDDPKEQDEKDNYRKVQRIISDEFRPLKREMENLSKDMWKLYDNKVKKFENTDDEYAKKAKKLNGKIANKKNPNRVKWDERTISFLLGLVDGVKDVADMIAELSNNQGLKTSLKLYSLLIDQAKQKYLKREKSYKVGYWITILIPIGGGSAKAGKVGQKSIPKFLKYLKNLIKKNGKKRTTVWDDITATQNKKIKGTNIPKSFKLKVGNKEYWIAPNATKHIVEYLNKKLSHGRKITEQQLLRSLQNAIRLARKKGYVYGKPVKVGNWELIFEAPRKPGLQPVVKHAVYRP